MKISMYSVVCAIVLSSVYFSILCMIRSRTGIRKKSQATIFVFLYLFGFLRLLFPIDFVFTRGIRLEGIFSVVWKFFFDRRMIFSGIRISIIEGIVLVVFLISLGRLLFLIKEYRKITACLKMLSCICDSEYQEIAENIQETLGLRNISVVKSSLICSPFTTGLFRKYVVLPDLSLTDSEVQYIFLHEFTHIKHRDTLKKMLLEGFRQIFWWIPFSSFLCRDLEQLLEIQCDRDVTASLSTKETVEYMRTFFNVTRKISERKSHSLTVCFALQESGDALIERFKLMAQEDEKLSVVGRCMVIAVLIIVLFSYVLIPMPYHRFNVETTNTEGTIISADNSYLLLQDGRYFLKTIDMPMLEISEEYAAIMIADGVELREKK